jgi:hypothetical protein
MSDIDYGAIPDELLLEGIDMGEACVEAYHLILQGFSALANISSQIADPDGYQRHTAEYQKYLDLSIANQSVLSKARIERDSRGL